MMRSRLILILIVLSVFSCKNASEKQIIDLENETTEVAITTEEVIDKPISEEEEKLQKKHLDSISQSRFFSPEGRSIHSLGYSFTRQELYHIYGKGRISERVIYNLDGMDVMGTEISFDNPADNFTIEWHKVEGLESIPRTIRISNKNATWKSESWKNGKSIGMGSTLAEVEAANNGKPFSIYGFEINDYISGMSKNWNGGGFISISLRFSPSSDIDPEVYVKLIGKNDILSNDPLLKEAGLVVDFIAIHFQSCDGTGTYTTEFCIAQLDFLPPEPKENLRSENWIKVALWPNSQEADVYFVENSILYDYGKYIIKQTEIGYPDGYENWFTVYNRVTQNKYVLDPKDEHHFFEGIINDLIIIDFGTGNSRSFLLYDANTGKLVFEDGYYNEIKIEGDKLIYEDIVTLTEEQKPECPQKIIDLGSYGYVEKYIYNTKTKVFNATGFYRCSYME